MPIFSYQCGVEFGSVRSGTVVEPVAPWFMHGVVSGGGRRRRGLEGKSTCVQYFTVLVKG